MALGIYLNGTTGGTDGTLEVPNDGAGLRLRFTPGSVAVFHLRCPSGYRTSESVTVTAPTGCEVSSDGVTYAATAVYASHDIADTNVACYLKSVSAAKGATGLVTDPRLASVTTEIPDVTAPVIDGTLTATPGDTQVTLTGPTATDAVGIAKWQYRVDAGSWVDIASTSDTMPSTDVTGLTNGTEYDFDVRVLDAADNASDLKSATMTPAIQSFLFTGANDSTGYTSVLNVWPNIVSADAVIDVNTHSVQSNALNTRITATVNAKFVMTEFISKSTITMPSETGAKLVMEATFTCDATVRENQIGIGIVAATTDPGDLSGWGLVDRNGIRLHLSQSASLSAAAMRFTQKVGTINTDSGSVVYTTPQGTPFTIRFEVVKRSDGNFDVYGYENDVLKTSNEAGIAYADATGYPTFYNQTAHTTAAALVVDDVRVWTE
jgi:hypothetical protein